MFKGGDRLKPFLEPDQMEAVKKLKNGCILNGGVGSGKSRTGLYYYFKECGGKIDPDLTYHPMKNPLDLYIITTARKRDTLEWEDELLNFRLTKHKENSRYDHTIIIDSWNNIKKYRKIHNAFFLFDEDRVTGTGVWVKSFLDISRKNKWIILSATPGDYWSDYWAVFVANGFYKNKTDFIQQHVTYKKFVSYPQIDHDRYLNERLLEKHKSEILINMDYNSHTHRNHIDIRCNYDKVLYRSVMHNRWNPFENKPIETASELCLVCRKITNSDITRISSLIDIFNERKKIIVFYSFNYELDILKSIDYGVEVREWNGHKHEKLPEGKSWIYLVQYSAGAEGWNCITTDTIVFFSQQYSYKIFEQTCGRIDRRNTPFTELYYYHLKSNAPIDLAISRALRNKKDFNERRYYGG